ncbi:hypothetical protein [Clostridium oceanicum]|uniref:Transglycosylase SLT domain-containing protein n=1 Tax=Clostridium oceanicum TaxID=1543 RepID=A0ABN1J8P8_9CLOT
MKKIGSILIIILILCIGVGLAARSIAFPIKNKSEIQKYSKEYKIKPEFVAAAIRLGPIYNGKDKKYGDFKLQAKAAKAIAKEMGLKDFNEKDLENKDLNIKIGTWFLAKYYKEKGLEYALAKFGGINYAYVNDSSRKSDKENKERAEMIYNDKQYVNKIKNNMKIYKILYPTL